MRAERSDLAPLGVRLRAGAGAGVRRRALVASSVTILLWDSSFAGFRAGLRAYMPGHLVLLRFLLASTALALYAGVTRMRLPARRDLPGLAVLGVVGVSVCQIALNMGEQTVTAGTASFLIVLVPVFTALLATVVLDERLTAIGWLGIALAMGGTAVLIVGQGQGLHATAGAGLVLIAAIAEAIYFVRQKSCLRRYSGLELATYTLWAATGGMLVFTPGLFHQLRVAPRRPPSQWSTWPSTQRPWAT